MPDLNLDYGAYSDMKMNINNNNDFIYLKSDKIPTVNKRETQIEITLDEKETDYFKFRGLNTLNVKVIESIVGVA